ncbi:MAG: hypothetical protein MRJ52_01455 [Nitrosomonas sp.]|nr:hypothetical protein [Nitrosomonas sp.]
MGWRTGYLEIDTSAGFVFRTLGVKSCDTRGLTLCLDRAVVNPILGKWKYARAPDAFIGLFDSRSGDIWVYKPTNWQPEIENEGISLVNVQNGETVYSNQLVELSVYAVGKNDIARTVPSGWQSHWFIGCRTL